MSVQETGRGSLAGAGVRTEEDEGRNLRELDHVSKALWTTVRIFSCTIREIGTYWGI